MLRPATRYGRVWLTGDWGLAEDLVRTTLARSWPRWERIRRRDDPEVYVRRVMVNTWITWSRRRWRGEKGSPAVPESPAAGDVAAQVATQVALRDALQALTGRQRAVPVLRVYDDLPEAQVAHHRDHPGRLCAGRFRSLGCTSKP